MFTATSNQTHPYVNANMWDASSKKKLKSKIAWAYSQINTKNGYMLDSFPIQTFIVSFAFWCEFMNWVSTAFWGFLPRGFSLDPLTIANKSQVCANFVWELRFVWDWPRCKDSDWQLLVAWRSSQIVDHIPQCALQLWI